jgi:hypothetical protein
MESKTINTLNWLLEKYLENPNAVWDITDTMNDDDSMEEMYEVRDHLIKNGYIRHQQALEDGFRCTITTLGIIQVSDVLNRAKFRILEASIEQKKSSIMEILEVDPDHYKKAHDYATYLKRMGIIECIFHPNDIFARPTFYGREWYQANKSREIN